jgi:hypothetical protein
MHGGLEQEPVLAPDLPHACVHAMRRELTCSRTDSTACTTLVGCMPSYAHSALHTFMPPGVAELHCEPYMWQVVISE